MNIADGSDASDFIALSYIVRYGTRNEGKDREKEMEEDKG
jgi:hypothetical protein